MKEDTIDIVPYDARYRAAFRRLNEEWIGKYFTVEPEDEKLLGDPEEHIIAGGGCIFIAVLNGEPVGTCALIRVEDDVYELSKMCVTPGAQGRHLGEALCIKAIEQAAAFGARLLYLETNSRLTTAIRLYERLGFTPVKDFTSVYARANVKMELLLS